MFATSGYTFPGWQMWPNNYPLYSSLMLNAGNSTREDEWYDMMRRNKLLLILYMKFKGGTLMNRFVSEGFYKNQS